MFLKGDRMNYHRLSWNNERDSRGQIVNCPVILFKVPAGNVIANIAVKGKSVKTMAYYLWTCINDVTNITYSPL